MVQPVTVRLRQRHTIIFLILDMKFPHYFVQLYVCMIVNYFKLTPFIISTANRNALLNFTLLNFT